MEGRGERTALEEGRFQMPDFETRFPNRKRRTWNLKSELTDLKPGRARAYLVAASAAASELPSAAASMALTSSACGPVGASSRYFLRAATESGGAT